jgi:hypothetical protein
VVVKKVKELLPLQCGKILKEDKMKKSNTSKSTTKNAKLAAVAPPKNKITRADVLTRILKKKKK